MKLQIDHVTIAGPSLADMEQAFAAVGLTTSYGGPHSNGITHMSLLGFPDGSYLELISFLESGPKETAFWGNHIAGNGGPCAWAVSVDDVAAEAARVAGLGLPVDGPHYYTRRRPDGMLVEWDLAFLDDKGAGATLPFIIKDITPRSLRVQPSDSVVKPGLLTGVNTVILGVDNLPDAVTLFQNVYQWPKPQITGDPRFGAMLAHFSGTPVTLASPLASDAWLTGRLSQFGDSPCAYLLGTDNFEATRQHYKLTLAVDWFGRPVVWFNLGLLNDLRLGVIENV